jgi:hypothetical protein
MDNQHEIEIRVVKLETIIGDKDSGMMSDIHSIKSTLEELKKSRWQLFGGLAVVVCIGQFVATMFLKTLISK